MHFHLRSVVLWPRNRSHEPRILRLEAGRLNVITGASRTGKSAVIPIVDYCLGSERCAVPVQTIRDACAWFGVVVTTQDGEKLFARREPGEQQSTGDMFVLEAKSVQIPRNIDEKNTTMDAVKRTLDRLAGLTNLGFEPGEISSGFSSRPGFRDMVAFTFQPQNIVANPDVLFFKADTMEHKEKLRTIFPYVLGAMTPGTLARQWEIDQISRELRKKERELNAQRHASTLWRAELQNWVAEARDLGLLSGESNPTDRTDDVLLSILEEVVKKTTFDGVITEAAIDNAATEAAELEKTEGEVSLQLVEAKARAETMVRLRSSVSDYSGALEKQRERLHLSRWLKDLADKSNVFCPVCGGGFEHSDELNILCDALLSIEASTHYFDPVPAVFDRELVGVHEKIRELSDSFKAVRSRRNALEERSARLRNERWNRSSIDRFLGRIEQALKVLKAPQGDPTFASAVAELRSRLATLRTGLSLDAIKSRREAALKHVSASMARLLPLLDAERPTDPAELNIEDLTIRVIGKSGRQDYLWEIGSGANWLSYHIAALLGLHSLFLSQESNPVPSMLVLDQPSQVYFPRKLAGRQVGEGELKLTDEDVVAVRKVFLVLADAVQRAKGALQVIVLDHAGSEVWEAAPGINLVEEWRDGEALIPAAWLASS